MEILSNKDKILEDHARHVAHVEGKEFKEVKTTQGNLDEMQAIKTLLMAILGKVRDIDFYVRQLGGVVHSPHRTTFEGREGKTTEMPSIKELNQIVENIIK